MAYDLTKLTRLQALQELARRTKAELNRADNRLDGLSNVQANVLNSMYQEPMAAQYSTKGNLTRSGTGSILEENLGSLLDLNSLTADETGHYPFTLNGQLIGSYTAESKLSKILGGINAENAGVYVSYNEASSEFQFTARETGTAGQITFGEGLAQAMFSPASVSTIFAKAYRMSWVGDGEDEDESGNVTFKTEDFNIESIEVSKDDTVQDVAAKLNQSIEGFGYTASYNSYTGQMEIKDKNGTAVDFSVWDAERSDWKLTFDDAYKPDVSYTPGQDGIFTAVKVNGEILKVSDKAVDIGAAIAEAVTGAGHLKRKKVASLDAIDLTAAGADQYIYMVPKSGSKNGDKYDEYMILDGALEKVGSWAVDLSGYVQTEEGKGLSSNDYTDEDKEKLTGLEFAADAEVDEMLDEIFGYTEEALLTPNGAGEELAEGTLEDPSSPSDKATEA